MLPCCKQDKILARHKKVGRKVNKIHTSSLMGYRASRGHDVGQEGTPF